ncbi:hypothetical protein [Aurantiacibacter spongiae]|uniref:Uncharacterized protein n=1 Tax=Aurantiacibacter spongiae TaxID=2488860 RepID=A0A3N5DAC9_9SPHN|nr:hypothetical protein [Aurantiacibacter spongiae]RPF71618.1 hypothetical protein EG799_08285 [Aurantiacibacter spongiae]
MFAFLKAIPLGIALTVIVCLFMGSGGTTGGPLNIRTFHFEVMETAITFYWSWMLFLGATALAFFLFLMMGD